MEKKKTKKRQHKMRKQPIGHFPRFFFIILSDSNKIFIDIRNGHF